MLLADKKNFPPQPSTISRRSSSGSPVGRAMPARDDEIVELGKRDPTERGAVNVELGIEFSWARAEVLGDDQIFPGGMFGHNTTSDRRFQFG